MKKEEKKPCSSDEPLEQRRATVRKILAASSVTAGMGASAWKTPVIESVVLPAHAQTSAQISDVVISAQIGETESLGLLDLFLKSAYAADDDLVGGCVAIRINGISVTVTVTLNTGERDSKIGTLTNRSFSVANVNGYTVTGIVDDQDNPTTCEGTVGTHEYSGVINGACSVIPPGTTTTTECPDGTLCPP